MALRAARPLLECLDRAGRASTPVTNEHVNNKEKERTMKKALSAGFASLMLTAALSAPASALTGCGMVATALGKNSVVIGSFDHSSTRWPPCGTSGVP